MSGQWDEEALRKAHREGATRNWKQVKRSTLVGCFCCLEIMPSELIVEYCYERDGDRTAMCAKCAIDSVLGDAGDFPVDQEFLTAMNRFWFG